MGKYFLTFVGNKSEILTFKGHSNGIVVAYDIIDTLYNYTILANENVS